MSHRSGSADLPLHGGRVPRWLADRMTRLGALMAEAIVREYGRDELLRRLAHPFWFQSFGAVMGMDWHSSGITTSVIGALKRGLQPMAGELGIHVCGGRGRHSRATPGELLAIGERVGFDGAALATASRLVAKVDSAAVQDGFDLYLHGFIVSDDGHWVVVQQGMNGERKQARRYHWLSEGLTSFVDDPHTAVDGPGQGRIVNLADHRALASRRAQVALLQGLGPDGIVRELGRIDGGLAARARPAAAVSAIEAEAPAQGELLPQLVMPAHHDVRGTDVIARRLHGSLAAAAENGPRDFTELLQVPGVGARTGDGGRGAARHAVSLHRPGALLAGARRQGPPSVAGADHGLRPHHRRAEDGGKQRAAGAGRGTGRAQAAGRPGAAAGAPRERADGGGIHSRRASPIARLRRAQRGWLGAAAGCLTPVRKQLSRRAGC